MAGIPDPVRDLVEELRVSAAALRARWDANDEHQFLDFKAWGKDDTEDRKNLAKALSGFRNAAGGVVIWGVGDPKTKSFGPGIKNVAAFKAWAMRAQAEVVDPPFAGVEFFPVELEPSEVVEPGSFAVLMLVPARGDGLPVQVKGKKERAFYFRVGESFVPLPTAILAGMFGAVPSSRCVPAVVVRGGQLQVEVRNEGRGMARDLYLLVECDNPAVRWSVLPTKKWVDRNERGPATSAELPPGDEPGTYSAFPDLLLPPLARVRVGTFEWRNFTDEQVVARGFTLRLRAGAGHDLATLIEYRATAEALERLRSARTGPVKLGPVEAWEAAVVSVG